MHAPIIILIRPQMGENIGAVARAMSNFGLSELRIVAPRDGWPNPKANEMSAGAEYIIAATKIYPDFPSAMADIHIAYATTARPRDMAKKVYTPAEAIPALHQKSITGARCALVFGPERTGIENDELTLCDAIITIPTDAKNHSLNLAQSAVIIGYEWMRLHPAIDEALPTITLPAPRADLLGLFDQLETYLDAADYFRVEHKKPLMFQNIKNMLLRGMWSEQEVRTFRGMLRALWERRLNAAQPVKPSKNL